MVRCPRDDRVAIPTAMIHLLPWHGDVDHGHFVLSCQHQAAPQNQLSFTHISLLTEVLTVINLAAIFNNTVHLFELSNEPNEKYYNSLKTSVFPRFFNIRFESLVE